MIVKTPDGRYLQQTFGLNRADEKLSYISESLAVTEMPAGFDYENSLLYMLVSDTYLVLAQGLICIIITISRRRMGLNLTGISVLL